MARRPAVVILVLLLFLPTDAGARPAADLPVDAAESGGLGLVAELGNPHLARLTREALDRHPGIAAAEARAKAARRRATQAGAKPDPMAMVTAFVDGPETRTGPQEVAVNVSQSLPWRGKLALREEIVLHEAAVLDAGMEALRLEIITEIRRLFYELAFLDRSQSILDEFRSHLLQHEEISRARYSTGVGSGQDVVKLQAEITRTDSSLLELAARRVALTAEVNALRDRPAGTAIADVGFPTMTEVRLDHERLDELASHRRPELAAAETRIRRADAVARLAAKGYRPDFKIGLVYTLVDRREDLAGRLNPPEANGRDILGIQGGITIPLWRGKLEAGVEEAAAEASAAAGAKQELTARILATVGNLARRVPLDWRRLRLLEDQLVVQAAEALESAQAGYVAGSLNALDLLDAEHVLFEARTAVARAKADYLIGLARLEGALGATLPEVSTAERSES